MNHRTNSKYDHPSYKSAEFWNFRSAPSGLKNCQKIFLCYMNVICARFIQISHTDMEMTTFNSTESGNFIFGLPLAPNVHRERLRWSFACLFLFFIIKTEEQKAGGGGQE